MRYNLKPILSLINESIPNHEEWKIRITTFFDKEHDQLDQYYDVLIKDIWSVDIILNTGVIIDEYTGLFSFTNSIVDRKHSFNLAYYIHRNYLDFNDSKVLTIINDYGMVNNQIKFCGIDLVNSIMSKELVVGSVLTCIGNKGRPYSINMKQFPHYDTILASCVFEDDNKAYKNWNFLLDEHAKGKKVYFTSNTFSYLKNYMNYDKIELLEKPNEIFDKNSYSDLKYGNQNRIYRIK
jgi:hypothetical protein